MRKLSKGQKIISKHEWILSTLKSLGQVPQKHLDILAASIYVDPNQEKTPYQIIIEKFSQEQQTV